jgi:DNA polymerase III epsilon subunit-like protein
MPATWTLVFDTETTGLPPRNVTPDVVEAWEKCRIVQIAWNVYDAHAVLCASQCFYIVPDGFEIPEIATRIHGITTDMARERGVAWSHVLEELRKVLPRVGTIVAHNMSFDDQVLRSELHRMKEYAFLAQWSPIPKMCTMRMGTLPKQKWPKLVELYERCFQRKPEGTLHRADVDVRACADIYFHLRG